MAMDNAAPGGGDHGGGSASSPDVPSSPQSPSSAPLLPRLLSGSLGSLATALAVTPLEVVKIRQQTAGGSHAIAPITFRGVRVEPCPGCGTLVLNNGLMECVLPVESTSVRVNGSNAAASGAKIGGTFSTLVSIFRHEGYAGLYKGLRPTLVMSVPNTVLYFTAYDEFTLRLRRMHTQFTAGNLADGRNTTIDKEEEAKRQSYIPLVAGSSARLLASLSTAPLELLRTRQASVVSHQHGPAPGMLEEFRLLLRTNGIGSFYVGLAPTLWRDVPFSAIYWLFLEKFRNALSDSDELGVWGGAHYRERGVTAPPGIEAGHAFVSGAAAGSIAAAFTTPFDVVKTRRQTMVPSEAVAGACDHNGLEEYAQRRNPASAGYTRLSNGGTFAHMRQIVRQEGLRGLWKGNATRMVKVAPACAIMISCYEFGKRVFGDML